MAPAQSTMLLPLPAKAASLSRKSGLSNSAIERAARRMMARWGLRIEETREGIHIKRCSHWGWSQRFGDWSTLHDAVVQWSLREGAGQPLPWAGDNDTHRRRTN